MASISSMKMTQGWWSLAYPNISRITRALSPAGQQEGTKQRGAAIETASQMRSGGVMPGRRVARIRAAFHQGAEQPEPVTGRWQRAKTARSQAVAPSKQPWPIILRPNDESQLCTDAAQNAAVGPPPSQRLASATVNRARYALRPQGRVALRLVQQPKSATQSGG